MLPGIRYTSPKLNEMDFRPFHKMTSFLFDQLADVDDIETTMISKRLLSSEYHYCYYSAGRENKSF